MKGVFKLVVCIAIALGWTTAFAAAHGQAESPKNASSAAGKQIVIQIWDHSNNLKAAHQLAISELEKAYPNVKVEHTIYNPAKMPQALELAFKSGNLPDITTAIVGGIPVAQLIHDGWFIPIDKYIDVRKNKLVAANLFNGLTVFGGHVYSLPPFSGHTGAEHLWYNATLLKQYGLSITNPNVTYGEAERIAREITQKSGASAYGIVLPLKFTSRMQAIVDQLAMAAGSAGPINWKTGAYEYDSPAYVNAIKFLLAFKQQGSLYPSSENIDARQARARWAAGKIGMFIDGPWNPGVLRGFFPKALSFAEPAWVPVPTASAAGYVYNNPPAAYYFLTSQSKHPAIAAQFFRYITSKSYYDALALGEGQTPLYGGVVNDVKSLDASWKKAIAMEGKGVLIPPDPQVRSGATSEVLGTMTDVHPNLGEILQGVMSGQIKNIKAALQTYNQAMTKARADAIQRVVAKGVHVGLNDWIFPNWNPAADYTPAMYAAVQK